MIVKSSVVTRPSTGKRVTWTLTQPIFDLATQAEAHGYPIAGTIGNPGHLDGSGDHTPWSKGKLPGWIYALDSHPPADFEKWLVALCKSNYDTTWIDFFNINGDQYDGAGNYVKPSGDEHFHLSVNKGFERTHVTLFDDYANKGDDMPTAEDVVKALLDHKMDSPALKIKGKTVGDFLKSGASADAKLTALAATLAVTSAADETRDRTTLAAITALTSALNRASGGVGVEFDPAGILAAVREEGEKTRKATADRATALLSKIAEAMKT